MFEKLSTGLPRAKNYDAINKNFSLFPQPSAENTDKVIALTEDGYKAVTFIGEDTDAIVKVETLPVENIDESRFYRYDDEVYYRVGDKWKKVSEGSGGGGGATNNAILTVTNTSGWVSKTIAEGAECDININWSSLENNIPTGNGTITVKVMMP
jgi:hypothetical protein